ncbi:hypothetical protein G3I44_05765 [Halogeometricum borinquense]|uniref:Uncharacterized protein n=1 Tax=Halogeometricum borinquense TaxID=60847 RepID=A0A6C0UCE7_9EURY|nr:hypothetical protein [Halogeometricum borinquense]QIB72790.1 hypothetical protein G3I44_05765 [Halogeometricum borinquense]
MLSTLRGFFLGRDSVGSRRRWSFVIGLFCITFAAYAVGVFTITGDIVFIPGQAILLGLYAAGMVGYERGGLVFAWLAGFAPMLGYHADHAFLGLSYRSLMGRVSYFLAPDGLIFFGIRGVIIGAIGFVVGWAIRRGSSLYRHRNATDDGE